MKHTSLASGCASRAGHLSNLSVLAFCAFVALGITSPASAEEAMFMGLGSLSGRPFFSRPSDVSADGSVVVGDSRSVASSGFTEGFRWENGEMTGLGDLPGGSFRSRASGVSADGSVVVGTGSGLSGREAFRWSNDTGTMVGLGDLPGGGVDSAAHTVSADGLVVVGASLSFLQPGGDPGGFSGSISGGEAFRWENGVMVGLGLRGAGQGVSADGSVIVGGFAGAYRWEGGVAMGLVDPGGLSLTVARSISSDGSVIVGKGETFTRTEAFRWENGVVMGLGDLPGGAFCSDAKSTSADGSVVVGLGNCASGALNFQAFIWNATDGMRSVRDVLVNDFGLDLAGWSLLQAIAISDDGLTIVGEGINPARDTEGWIARLPGPPIVAVEIDIKPGSDPNSINPSLEGDLPVAILGSETFDVEDVDVTTLAFGPSGAPIDHSQGPHFEDLNGDGLTDLMSHFRIEETGIEFGDMEACVTGETLGGVLFKGCDAVRTVPDMDGDGLLDVEEAAIGTDALNPDTDGDGFGDGLEVLLMGTDPLNALDPRPTRVRSGKRPGRRHR